MIVSHRAGGLSEQQIRSIKGSNARLNIWEGSVRSGKTFSSILRFAIALREGPPGHAMIVGPTRDSIQRNVISEMCDLLSIPPPTPKSATMSLFGRTIHLVGASDERAQRRIQGSTLALAYTDEITLLPQNFFRMLLSRLSVTGAQLFGTTNPDSPFHWLKTDFLDKPGLEISRFKFTLDDNPSLSQTYVDALKREYQGLWYQRYIEGHWVLADGTVYDFFDEQKHLIEIPPRPLSYIVGVDYGTVNPTVFLLVGINPQTWPNVWVEREYYYDSRKEMRQKTDSEYAEDMIEFIKGKNVAAIYIDPSAASFRAELAKQGVDLVSDANNDVLNGIRHVSKMLSNGTCKVVASCKNLIREFGTYVWDSKAVSRGDDKPLKDHDHALDALRYALHTHFGDDYGTSTSADELDNLYHSTMYPQDHLPGPLHSPLTQQYHR